MRDLRTPSCQRYRKQFHQGVFRVKNQGSASEMAVISIPLSTGTSESTTARGRKQVLVFPTAELKKIHDVRPMCQDPAVYFTR
jgi:hypothetical protein